MSPGGEGQHQPNTALAECWDGGTAISWGKILNEEKEDSSLMDGEGRRFQQQLSSSRFPFGLGSLGRYIVPN